MIWIGISGGWRKTNSEIENLVRQTVREIILRGDGIVSGGALGVDSFALDEALKNNPTADQIRIFLPASLKDYAIHYRKRADEGVITKDQAENLIVQLTSLKQINPSALIENPNNSIMNKETYYNRNSEIVKASDELIAFQIKSEASEGLGTGDTIEKARQKGIPVKFYKFDLSK